MELECDVLRDNLIEFFKSNVNKLNPLQKDSLCYLVKDSGVRSGS